MLTVTTAAESNDLISFESAAPELGIGSTEADIERLANQILQASATIASHCNRTFGLETISETFRLTRSSGGLLLARYPVTEILSIESCGQVVPPDEYEFESFGALRRLSNDCPSRWSAGKTIVSYRAGYALPDDAPADLARAALLLIQYYRSGRDPLQRSLELNGVVTLNYQDYPADLSFPPEVESLVSRHRVPIIGSSSCL